MSEPRFLGVHMRGSRSPYGLQLGILASQGSTAEGAREGEVPAFPACPSFLTLSIKTVVTTVAKTPPTKKSLVGAEGKL